MAQAPMIAVPLKATNEIDWISPLKSYIQNTYGDDPERYAEECAAINRLRQDMRGAGKDSTAGRDLLYRYYGQLELLDLRFPVDEQHIKISFTWFDAFTHKPTSQHSLAFEKASIIFNISAVLSCHAAHQTRTEESGLKTAYHSFQASAGMFTYINENFLHAPSADLSRETVKTLINIMLAQAQEVFLEKQITDQKKVGLLAKLASQAATLYGQAAEGVQDNVNRAIFEKVWLQMVQAKYNLMTSMAQYFQALADDDANSHGMAIARLQVAEALARDANKISHSFPGTLPPNANLNADAPYILQEITKRHWVAVQDKLRELNKDNDFIYHQPVPAEAGVPPVAKLPAAKPIPVSELYAGQDISRITGPDLFAKIVPLAVTESASLYDEEKAKLVRAETERVDQANSEMAASLDYLRLPGALQVLKGGFDQEILPDEDFRTWCVDVADHENPGTIFDSLHGQKQAIMTVLDRSAKQLDMEESVCEKMRSKYDSEWTQQPSSRLTTTLRSDIRGYREALDEAARSDQQLFTKLRQNQNEFDEMRLAAETGEVDALFQRAVNKGRKASNTNSPSTEPNLLDADFDDGGPSVVEQIAKVEDILKKLNLIKRERTQVLKDLKEKAHNDDISQILILNKKSIVKHEQQLFQQELEKFRPYQTRLVQATHKQAAMMRELTLTFNNLLQDKRVRAEQSKYESIQRTRASVIGRYKRAYQEFLDLEAGLQSAKNWYKEMRETVESMEKNVDTFVNNRRSEGAQLLNQIEQARAASKSSQAALEQERLRGLMERMSMEQPPSPPKQSRPVPAPLTFNTGPAYHKSSYSSGQHTLPSSPPPTQTTYGHHQQQSSQSGFNTIYNPSSHGRIPGPASPPATQSTFNLGGHMRGPASPPPNQTSFGHNTYGNPNAPPQGYQQPPPQQQQQAGGGGYVPPNFVPPPPPPGPPPLGPQQMINYGDGYYNPNAPPRPGSASQHQHQHQQQQQHQLYQGQVGYPNPNQGGGAGQDPWAGLNAWK
ncbi:bck1-like resistance to osmotic shock [Podospora pseudopauciseta]|uniref:BRO domain-containing protein 1 n=1 Tax=Podospora pseudopauciseta TaxID=2093780 RepID=A0ABR0H4P6_9PEZI|nr:bck1-like resistance to osmotic shock [Podospora pseudopauciseta]